ncbi:Hemolysin-type calcium-binding repeat-containing protein [Belnapia rosea]|uniref:Hemolysin-type calcium-binding repeat-containing protein n=1 Tax=Belnapia rosea TaxID=938405 RepID=A0A1G7CNU9_9PROT|nr:Hemolysin-type calcium-binding repeat-containing protein [Belnapia rosea]
MAVGREIQAVAKKPNTFDDITVIGSIDQADVSPGTPARLDMSLQDTASAVSASEIAARAALRNPPKASVQDSGARLSEPASRQVTTSQDGQAETFLAATSSLAAADIAYTTIVLTSGNDSRVISESGSFSVQGLGGNDVISVLAGTTGSDLLDGGAGLDRLTGAETDDILIGGAGADTLNGGAGSDTADYSASGAMLVLTLSTSTTSSATSRPSGGDATGDVLSNIENVVGTAFGDLVSGNQLDNQLVGGLGNDTVRGNAGADLLYGDSTTEGAAQGGVDLVDGGDGNDTLHGGAANDSLLGSFGNDELHGDAGDDLLSSSSGDDLLDGGDGNDQFVASIGNDTLYGGAGNDDLNASSGNDEVHGGDGNDTATGADGTDSLAGDAGNDVLAAGIGLDTVTGGDGDDSLDGGQDADQVTGGSGNDTLAGGAGDTIDGGEGIDTLTFANAAGAAGVDLTNGIGSGAAAGASFANIENLTGSGFNDILIGNSLNNTFVGGAGADQMIGQGGLDTADYSASDVAISIQFTATPENPTAAGTGTGGHAAGDSLQLIERVIGSAFADSLNGGGVGEIFVGGLGADLLNGGGGNDTADYSFSTAAVTVNLLAGTASDGDQLTDMENVIGTAFADTLFGSAAANRLEGGTGNDWFRGGAGADTMFGGVGTDTADFSTSDGGVQIQLLDSSDPNSAGVGSALGSTTSDAAGDRFSQIENVVGSGFADLLLGSTIGNKLVSGAGNDSLRGGSGADLLVSNGIGTKLLVGEGIGDGGSPGLDTYRVIGAAGGTTVQISGYQIGEDIELNSLVATPTITTAGGGTARIILFQGSQHNTFINLGLATAVTQETAQAVLDRILAPAGSALDTDGDGRDLIVNSGLTADSPWL